MNAALSPRQREVAALVAQGYTDGEISGRLKCSEHTIGFHLRVIYAKLQIRSRVQLALFWAETEKNSCSYERAGIAPRKKRL